MKNNKRQIIFRNLFLAAGTFLPVIVSAQEENVEKTVSYFSNPLFNTLLAIIIILLIMAVALGSALKNLINSDLFAEKLKREKEQKNTDSSNPTTLVIIFMLLSFAAFSQDKAARVIDDGRIGGLDQFTFYFLICLIAGELLVIGMLFNTFKSILGTEKAVGTAGAQAKPRVKTILDKLNYTVEIEQEESIMLDHDYDGIKELDNNLPPWWKYGFYLTILVAIIYLTNYHITNTAPLQKEEYTNSVKKAEAEVAEFMKNSANNVDENTVKLLTEASDVNAGKDIFLTSCSACHGRAGEGTVGPNLTDEYWLHGGSVKDVFKTIKYGWPDKGMKSWKEDFSPIQIAQITSYIRTLKGTNPPKAKEKQGDLYTEQNAATDSTAIKVDSTKTIAAELPK